MLDKTVLYQKLAAPEKAIVQLLALANDPLPRTTIQACLRRLEIRNERGIYFAVIP